MAPSDLHHLVRAAAVFVRQLAGARQPACAPELRRLRVLEHPAEAAHLLDGARCAACVLLGAQEAEPRPRPAWRMRDDGMGAVVALRVARLAPAIHAGHGWIGARCVDVESGDLHVDAYWQRSRLSSDRRLGAPVDQATDGSVLRLGARWEGFVNLSGRAQQLVEPVALLGLLYGDGRRWCWLRRRAATVTLTSGPVLG